MKNKALAYLFVILGAVTVVASLYFVISYLSFIGNVMIQFFSANSTAQMADCGIVMPSELIAIRDQFPTTIIPALYLGLPIVLLLIAGSMFAGGYYYGRYMSETESLARRKRNEEIEAEVARRTGQAPKREEKEQAQPAMPKPPPKAPEPKPSKK